MNQVGALAVALAEAQRPSFTAYAHQVVANARALAEALLSEGLRLVTGGTDNHMLILDLRAFAKSGKFYSGKLAQAGIVANFNMVPEDPRSPATTSGIRIGTPAMTTAGMTTGEMAQIARFIGRVIRDPSPLEIDAVRAEVQALCGAFPPPGYDAR
jgi:glycine hydroxymethyltransferase